MDKSVSIVSLDLVYHTVRGQTPLPAHLYYDIIICVYTSERALSIVAERDYFAIDLKSFYASENIRNYEVKNNGETYMRILQ